MFSQQTISPWSTIQRASQVTMILLAVAVLFIPILTQPQEAEAAAGLVIGGIIALGCLYIAWEINDCDNCGKNGVGDAHKVKCPKEHWYYNCSRSNNWHHEPCFSSS